MNKNYYDILQVNRNASPEIIEKAYKTLAKKYHPDLQTEENKKQSEEILKEINEAYEILSDSEKKYAYDASLSQKEAQSLNYSNEATSTSSLSEEELHFRKSQEILRKQQLQQKELYQEQLRREQELVYQQQMEQARRKAYYDAYIQDLKNRGYKIRYKKSLKDYIKSFIAILIFLLILFLLWQIPFIKKFFIDLYNENSIIHSTVDIFIGIFNSSS